MTPQEIYDKVYHRLTDGTGRAMDPSGFCAYRTHDGRACAVGVLLSDEEASEADRYGQVLDLLESNTLPERLAPYWRRLENLQALHDEAGSWDDSGKYLTSWALGVLRSYNPAVEEWQKDESTDDYS